MLFSMMVSASFLASYDVTTFFLGITYVVGSGVRTAFLFGSFMGFIYEMSHPDALLKLVEGIYMARHEEDLVAEEEYYLILVEIMRSPEMMKALTGSSIKGSCAPDRDKMPLKVKQKLQHLENLERRDYDVTEMKKDILAKYLEK